LEFLIDLPRNIDKKKKWIHFVKEVKLKRGITDVGQATDQLRKSD